MPVDDPTRLPEGLPAPQDDGAAAHLPGARVPDLALPATDGTEVSLAHGDLLVAAFPWAGRPGEDPLDEGWDAIPGARGCTPELCGLRDAHAGLSAVRVLGLSAQSPERQREIAERLGLPFALVSDEGLALTRSMRLPTFDAGGRTLLRRLTMRVRDGVVARVWYPVFPPDDHAARLAAELASG